MGSFFQAHGLLSGWYAAHHSSASKTAATGEAQRLNYAEPRSGVGLNEFLALMPMTCAPKSLSKTSVICKKELNFA